MRKFFFYIILLLGTAVIMATLGSAVATEKFWWMKILDFPRIQFLIVALVLLPIFLWLKEEWDVGKVLFTLGLVTTVGIQFYYIYPYSELVNESVKAVTPGKRYGMTTFDLVVANIYIHNRQAEEFLQIIDDIDPDMILAMETDKWWENALQPLDDRYPYGMEYPLNNAFGMILYSRFPLQRKKVKFLNFEKVPSFHTRVKLPGGELFGFHGVHPVPPLPGKPGSTGGKETTLIKVGRLVEADSLPAVVAGDLNDVAWARRERLFEQDGLLNDVRIGRAVISTYNAKTFLLRWPLDYVYVTDEFGVVDFQRLEDFGSDHFPIYIKLGFLERN